METPRCAPDNLQYLTAKLEESQTRLVAAVRKLRVFSPGDVRTPLCQHTREMAQQLQVTATERAPDEANAVGVGELRRRVDFAARRLEALIPFAHTSSELHDTHEWDLREREAHLLCIAAERRYVTHLAGEAQKWHTRLDEIDVQLSLIHFWTSAAAQSFSASASLAKDATALITAREKACAALSEVAKLLGSHAQRSSRRGGQAARLAVLAVRRAGMPLPVKQQPVDGSQLMGPVVAALSELDVLQKELRQVREACLTRKR